MPMSVHTQKPPWLKKRLPSGPAYESVREILKNCHLHTVCQEARCPNQWECYAARTATFLIMGPSCTRNCRFCAVTHGMVYPLDALEPSRVANAAQYLGLSYVVITSVTRDDLPDGGAGHFAATVLAVRERLPEAGIEVLIPDFQGNPEALRLVLNAKPDVLNHNVETVPRLYPAVRPEAAYPRSIDMIRQAGDMAPHIQTKSGLMLGLGETSEEIRRTLTDLRNAGCRILTLGQYLQPSSEQLPVERYVPPEEFDDWKAEALNMGFLKVASGPFIRSSYHAGELSQKRFSGCLTGDGCDKGNAENIMDHQ